MRHVVEAGRGRWDPSQPLVDAALAAEAFGPSGPGREVGRLRLAGYSLAAGLGIATSPGALRLPGPLERIRLSGAGTSVITATMQEPLVHKVVLRPVNRAHACGRKSWFPAWRTRGLGVVTDELAFAAPRLDPRSGWPALAAQVLIGVAGGVRGKPAFV